MVLFKATAFILQRSECYFRKCHQIQQELQLPSLHWRWQGIQSCSSLAPMLIENILYKIITKSQIVKVPLGQLMPHCCCRRLQCPALLLPMHLLPAVFLLHNSKSIAYNCQYTATVLLQRKQNSHAGLPTAISHFFSSTHAYNAW